MGRDFGNKLKSSKNIAIIADTKKGLEALCSSIALKEIVDIFLKNEEGFVVTLYYLSSLPKEVGELQNRVKINTTIGEQTLYVRFKSKGIKKVLYDYNEKKQQFELGVVGFKGEANSKSVSYNLEKERVDMALGVGFLSESDFKVKVPYIKTCENIFVFNKTVLNSKTLINGIMELYTKEGIDFTNLASLSFFTYFKNEKV